MKTLTSREVQKNFGAVADIVSAGESVRVTKYGRPAFFIVPETAETEEILRQMAGMRLTRILKGTAPSSAAQALTQKAVNQLIEDCFA